MEGEKATKKKGRALAGKNSLRLQKSLTSLKEVVGVSHGGQTEYSDESDVGYGAGKRRSAKTDLT